MQFKCRILLYTISCKSQYVFFEEINTFVLLFTEASNHHIRMISEGSCDIENWSNGC